MEIWRRTYIFTNTYTHTYTCMYTYAYSYSFLCIYPHAYILQSHIYTNTHQNLCGKNCSRPPSCSRPPVCCYTTDTPTDTPLPFHSALENSSVSVCRSTGKLERICLSINFSSEFSRIHAKETQKSFDPTKAKFCKLVQQRWKTRSSTF